MKILGTPLNILVLGTLLLSPAYAADEKAGKLTDMAALNIQDRSITKLQSLLKQYRGTQREPELLYRLADLYLQRTGITFRISEGTSVQKKTAQYSTSLKESIRVLTELLAKYPYHVHAPMAHFKRGKAHKELQQIKQARADYLHIDQNYKDFEYLDSALIDLADFAQDANQHQEALSYLSKIEKMQSDYYPIAIHKSAWSYYNLGLHLSSIEYLKKEINFYFDRVDAKKNVEVGAELAFLESAFNDLALFYFEAFNKKAPFARVDKTVESFKSLDRNKKFFGSTVVKFARLLKAYTLIPELNELKDLLIDDYIELSETSEVAMVLFQFHFERKDFNSLMPLIKDLSKIRKSVKSKELDQKIEAGLSSALTELHRLVLKNKKATEVGTLVRPLISLTESVNELMGPENTTSLLANYSLAETSFELEDYARATQKYLELLDPKYAPVLESKKVTHHSLALRLLSSRYRELRKDQLVPEKLVVRALNSKVSPASKDQLAKMREWITWFDQHVKTVNAKTPVEDRQSYDAFALEANKLIYEFIDQPLSLLRLEEFAFKHPESFEGQTSISIVLDTLSKSEDWDRIYALSQKLLPIKSWKDKAFLKRVNEMSADAHLRITLNSGDAELVLKRTEECVKKFKNLKTGQECEIIQAKTHLSLNQFEKAEKELSHLLSQVKEPAKVQSLLLLRADARNKLGRMNEGMNDLYQYQTMTDFKDSEVTQNMLQHFWYRQDYSKLDSLLKNKKVCSGKTQEICEQFEVVRILDEGRESSIKFLHAFKNTVKAPKSLIPVWALIALRDPKKIAFQDRLVLLQRLSNSWDNMNPLLQIHLFPLLQNRTKDALESVKFSAPGIAPLTSDPASIERRMRLMQDIDNTFAKVMKLNWIDIKLKGAHELSEVYTRLIQDLRAIQTPEDLLKPFIKKTAEIEKAIETLHEMAMRFKPAVTVAAAKGKARAVASSDGDPIVELLLSSEIKTHVPAHLWNEWKSGVQSKRRDYLYYLVSIVEASNPQFKDMSQAVKGVILLTGNAPTEAFELVKAAPDSPWKSNIIAQFEGAK